MHDFLKYLYISFFKRIIDFAFALILFIFLFPIFIIVTVIVFMTMGEPVFFKQERPGENEKLFTILKFRTMSDKKAENGELLPDMERITKFGAFLRSTSLDELPQLINILKGNLSFIGPRPLLIEYLPLYNDEQRIRHTVKPGITGWAQVNGRNSLQWNEKFKLDLYYVENISLSLDLKIVMLTLLRVFKRSDIYNEDGQTMEKFTGNT